MQAERNGFSMGVSDAGNRLARAWTRAVGLPTCTGLQSRGGLPRDQQRTSPMPETKKKRCSSLGISG